MNPSIQYTSTTDGVRIAYYAMGDGMPFVATSELQWSHLGNTMGFREHHRSQSPGGLGRNLQVVRYDARGTGLSDQLCIDFSLEAQMRDLQAVLDALRLDRFALFGHTHGCELAIAYAACHPDRVSHLVLATPHVRGRDLRPIAENLGLHPMSDMSSEQWEKYTLTVAHAATGFSSLPLAHSMARNYRDAMTPASYFQFLAAREVVDVADLLPQIRVPTLVLSHRTTARPALEIEVAERIPGSRLVTIAADPAVHDRWLPADTDAVEEFLGVSGVAQKGATAGPDGAHLTSRELEVLALVVAGQSNREVAEALVLSERTVARHIANMYEKTGAHGRAEITAYALRRGLA